MIQTQGGMFETRNLEVDLTESGVLVKATGESTNETIDIVTGTIKTAVGLAAKASNLAMLSSGVEVASFEKKLPFEQRQCWNRLEEPFAISVRRAQLKIDSSGKPPLDDSERERRLEEEIDKDLLSKRSSFIQAQNAFEQIAALELQRNDLFHGTNIPPDTLKLMIDELDKRIASSRGEFFFGTKETLTWNPTFRLNPTPASKSVDLFTFSKAKGVCEILANKPPHNQGVSFDARFRLEGVCSDASTVSLAIQEGENGEGGPDSNTQFAQIVSGSKLKSDGARGFYYRIPGRAVAFLKKADTELARAPLSIAQFGEVVSLPASTGGRRTKYTLALYEASGGLKNFVMGSDALIKQKNIDDIAGGAQTAIEAKGERKKAKAPADELQQLERQRKILEERKKIKDLEKELDTGNPSP